MTPFLGEFIGTAILIILGQGVVSNVVLAKTKGNNSGWIVITFGWAMAVYVGVFVAAPYSGAHLNPAVTLGLAAVGTFAWSSVVPYIVAQMAGAMTGSLIVWLAYRPHFSETDDANAKLAVFCTAPAIRSPINNMITEMIGTFMLVFAVLYIAAPSITLNTTEGKLGLGAIGALPVSLLVLAIGLSLGGPTGYAINPARDLGPRIMHFILPIPKKRDSDWGYAWVPIIGPSIGALLAALVYRMI
ncbi:MAG: aquaporin family protein [Bacteroidetes bacterium]|jgi:glycerol uptake facilitator protein|nr:aquaporin family protein [Bacteroidota bacterium]